MLKGFEAKSEKRLSSNTLKYIGVKTHKNFCPFDYLHLDAKEEKGYSA